MSRTVTFLLQQPGSDGEQHALRYPQTILEQGKTRSDLFASLLQPADLPEDLTLGPWPISLDSFGLAMRWVVSGLAPGPMDGLDNPGIAQAGAVLGAQPLVSRFQMPTFKQQFARLSLLDTRIFAMERYLRKERHSDRKDVRWTDLDAVFVMENVVDTFLPAIEAQPANKITLQKVDTLNPIPKLMFHDIAMPDGTVYKSFGEGDGHKYGGYMQHTLKPAVQRRPIEWHEQAMVDTVRDSLSSRFPGITRDLLQHFCIAGGAVLRTFTYGSMFSNDVGGDIDFFLTTTDAEVAHQAVSDLLAFFAQFQQPETHVVQTDNAVSFVLADSDNPEQGIDIQVITRMYNSVVQVLTEFDIDPCRAAWTWDHIYVAPSFVRALVSNYTLCYPDHDSASYGFRLRKYLKRGFALAVPGLDLARVVWHSLLDADTAGLARVIRHVNLQHRGTMLQDRGAAAEQATSALYTSFQSGDRVDTQLRRQLARRLRQLGHAEPWCEAWLCDKPELDAALLKHQVVLPFRMHTSLADFVGKEDGDPVLDPILLRLQCSVPDKICCTYNLIERVEDSDTTWLHHMYTTSSHAPVATEVPIEGSGSGCD